MRTSDGGLARAGVRRCCPKKEITGVTFLGSSVCRKMRCVCLERTGDGHLAGRSTDARASTRRTGLRSLSITMEPMIKKAGSTQLTGLLTSQAPSNSLRSFDEENGFVHALLQKIKALCQN